MQVSEQDRQCIRDEYEMCGSYARVARMCGCIVATVKRWAHRESTKSKKGRGRKHALNTRGCRSAFLLLTSNIYNGARGVVVAKVMRKRPGISETLSKHTVIRSARSYAESIGKPIYCDMKKPQQQLTENCKLARIAFCQTAQGRDWANVMFTGALRAYLGKHPRSHISILNGWPACSPDLSIIEHFGGWLQIEMNKCGCKTVLGFKKCLLKLITTTPMSLFNSYYNSIPLRMQECIDKHGRRVHY